MKVKFVKDLKPYQWQKSNIKLITMWLEKFDITLFVYDFPFSKWVIGLSIRMT